MKKLKSIKIALVVLVLSASTATVAQNSINWKGGNTQSIPRSGPGYVGAPDSEFIGTLTFSSALYF